MAVLLVSGGTVLPSQAQYSRPRSTDGEFLSISVSPRAAGMGDAFIAAVEGAEVAYYNPAGLPWIGMNATDVMLHHTRWFAGVNHEFAAVAHSFGYAGTVVASVTALYTDAMKERTPLQPNGTGETFMTTNVRLGLSYARWVTDRVTFGGTISLIHLGLYQDFAAKALAFQQLLYLRGGYKIKYDMASFSFGGGFRFDISDRYLRADYSFSDFGILGVAHRFGINLNISKVRLPHGGPELSGDVPEASFRAFTLRHHQPASSRYETHPLYRSGLRGSAYVEHHGHGPA